MSGLDIAETVAIAATGFFFAVALYVSLVEHPARIEAGIDVALREFGPSYRRAARLQASLAVVGTLAAATSWILGAGLLWAVSAMTLFAVVPFTLLVIFPTNQRLLDPGLSAANPDAARLLSRWGALHAVRTALSFAALALQLGALHS